MEQIVFCAKQENYALARQWVENQLCSGKTSISLEEENIAVFEELFLRIVAQCDPDTEVSLSIRRKLYSFALSFEFIGSRFVVDYDSGDQSDPGLLILQEFSDKISYQFKRGVNTVIINAKRRYDIITYASFAAALLGIAAYLIMHSVLSEDGCRAVTDVLNIGERFFFEAIMMISAPVTFFSLISNVTSCVVHSDRSINLRKLFWSMLCTSVLAIAVSCGLYLGFTALQQSLGFTAVGSASHSLRFSENIAESLLALIPTDLFSAFSITSPFPLIILAVLMITAICSLNKEFHSLKHACDTVNALFGKILTCIMFFRPAVVFFATLNLLLADLSSLRLLGATVLLLLIGSGILHLFQMLSLLGAGIRPIPFLRKCRPILHETSLINSCIDAVPFISRKLSSTFGISRRLIRGQVNILAQLNLDGNCFVLSMLSLLIIFYSGNTITPIQMLFLAILILAISTGAPNQPGSIIIGLTIVTAFLGLEGYYSIIILSELLFGPLVLRLNTRGDLSIIAANAKKSGSFHL